MRQSPAAIDRPRLSLRPAGPFPSLSTPATKRRTCHIGPHGRSQTHSRLSWGRHRTRRQRYQQFPSVTVRIPATTFPMMRADDRPPGPPRRPVASASGERGSTGHPRRLRFQVLAVATSGTDIASGRVTICDAIHSFYRRRQCLRPPPRLPARAATTLANTGTRGQRIMGGRYSRKVAPSARGQLTLSHKRAASRMLAQTCNNRRGSAPAMMPACGPPEQLCSPRNMTRSTPASKYPPPPVHPADRTGDRSISRPLAQIFHQDQVPALLPTCAKARDGGRVNPTLICGKFSLVLALFNRTARVLTSTASAS